MYAPAVLTTTGPLDVDEAISVGAVIEVDILPDSVDDVDTLLVDEIVALPEE